VLQNLANEFASEIGNRHTCKVANSEKSTRGYPKMRGLFKYLLNHNVYCNDILSAYLIEYYKHNFDRASINNYLILL
jgi:hypothetical protein